MVSKVQSLTKLLATDTRCCCTEACSSCLLLLVIGAYNLSSASWGLVPFGHFLLYQASHDLLVPSKAFAALNLATTLPCVFLILKLLLSLLSSIQLPLVARGRSIISMIYQLLRFFISLILDGSGWVRTSLILKRH